MPAWLTGCDRSPPVSAGPGPAGTYRRPALAPPSS